MIACLLPLLVNSLSLAPAPQGLYVRDGIIMRAGKPYRGIGVNYFNCFARTLQDPGDTSYEQGFAQMKRLGLPFARFMCGGFWPVDMKLYRENSREYFARLDRVVRSAERNGIGLIPSLFWNLCTVPDIVGEPCSSWGDPKCRTVAFMRRYTRDVVQRYRNSPAIWGWEFGNEYNLAADLPNAAEHRPPVWPSLGTAASRSERDELTHTMFRTALREFAIEVRKHDPQRIIISGNSIPRPSAWHQMHERSWTRDTPAQFREMLLGDNPDPMDTLCIHAYEPDDLARLAESMVAARESHKPLFVGEFGVQGRDTPENRARFRQVLDAMEASNVPLAALWVYDFGGQDKTWNVTWDNERAWQLELVAQRHRAWQRSSTGH